MKPSVIHQKIVEIRGLKVMLDFDLAHLYGVETKVLNQAVKRNPEKFSRVFMFRLSTAEWRKMRSQIVTASQNKRNADVTPFAFTEHGVAMAATILKSRKAVKMSIAIVKAFIALKEFALLHKDLAVQLKELRQELYDRLGEHDTQLKAIYDAIENLLDEKEATRKWQQRRPIGFKTSEE